MPVSATSPQQLTPGEAVARQTITAYTLTPEQLHKAEGLHRVQLVLSFGGFFFSLAILSAIIALRIVPRLERVARIISRSRFVQAWIVVPSLLLALAVLGLPLEAYGHHISLASGLSVQGWGSWFADQCKVELIEVLFGTLLLWGLYSLISRAPRRWWLYAWLASLPIMATVLFVAPVLIDPIFNRFEPLANTHPELTRQLSDLAHSAGLQIPDSRIFLMHASDKVTTYNAYVTGFGATKRIVVWDTTAHDLTLPQTLFVFGHEMGHYVLHHTLLGLAFTALLSLVGLWLAQRLAEAAVERLGSHGQIAHLADWSSLPLLLLLAALLSFFADPLANTFSRHIEHQADVFALTLLAPRLPDVQQTGAQTFQLLGEKSYSIPNPSPLLVFWSYSHPPIAQRVRFALSFDTRSALPK